MQTRAAHADQGGACKPGRRMQTRAAHADQGGECKPASPGWGGRREAEFTQVQYKTRNYIVLYHIVLYCIALCYIVLYYVVLCSIILYYIVLLAAAPQLAGPRPKGAGRFGRYPVP